ncbi:hypothetical protein CBOM_02483 [Ceraceosorus bombacis]|uniref:Uncharacterized protein n=1 Tax=Ceraceosorus bombacis TaxID=401625 RepID=A0A0P1BF45_9BASI|nr:hypothetical protein CBOM_02483 [Ceraceosorus bombacis]
MQPGALLLWMLALPRSQSAPLKATFAAHVEASRKDLVESGSEQFESASEHLSPTSAASLTPGSSFDPRRMYEECWRSSCRWWRAKKRSDKVFYGVATGVGGLTVVASSVAVGKMHADYEAREKARKLREQGRRGAEIHPVR